MRSCILPRKRRPWTSLVISGSCSMVTDRLIAIFALKVYLDFVPNLRLNIIGLSQPGERAHGCTPQLRGSYGILCQFSVVAKDALKFCPGITNRPRKYVHSIAGQRWR